MSNNKKATACTDNEIAIWCGSYIFISSWMFDQAGNQYSHQSKVLIRRRVFLSFRASLLAVLY